MQGYREQVSVAIRIVKSKIGCCRQQTLKDSIIIYAMAGKYHDPSRRDRIFRMTFTKVDRIMFTEIMTEHWPKGSITEDDDVVAKI
jgi:hypothetical protein